MKYTVVLSIVAAAMLVFASAASDAVQHKGGAAKPGSMPQTDHSLDRDRLQERNRQDMPDRAGRHDQDKQKDRIHAEDPMQLADQDIYGGELMTASERNKYRQELKAAETKKAKEEFQIRHEEKMRKRAEEQGKDLVPPGQGKIYGGELMTVQERNEYREQQRRFDTDEGLAKFQAQHREEMQKKAAALGLDIEEAQ